MDEYQHPLFFEAKELTDTEKQKIRRYFQIRRICGGGDCGMIEKVGDNTYKICFKEKEDQERVLQRNTCIHTISLPSGELQLTVSQTNSPQTPKPTDQPSTSHSQIEHLQNVHLQRADEVQKGNVSDKDGRTGPAGEKVLYRGTTQDNCDSIMKTGLNGHFADRRIVLLGKTGAGKSSLANTIFREDVFKIDDSPNTGTSQCAKETRSVNGRNITLIDTPGFFDPDKSEEELRDEIVKCIIECAPGPHVFLILLKVEKFTMHEKQVIDEIRKSFSEEAFKYAAVVFTHGDQLPEGMKIEDFVQENKDLSDLVKKCGGRCHIIDNKHWKDNQQYKYRRNQFQVAELLKTIDKIVMENNGGYYTNEMLQTVRKEIQKEEERIRLLSVTISEEEITKQAKVNVLKKFSIRLAGTATGVLLGALLGVPGMIILVIKALMTMQSTAAVAVEAAVGAAGGAAAAVTTGLGIAAGVAAGVAVTVGAVVGGCVGYDEADKADSVGEAVKNTAKAVCNENLQTIFKIQLNKK